MSVLVDKISRFANDSALNRNTFFSFVIYLSKRHPIRSVYSLFKMLNLKTQFLINFHTFEPQRKTKNMASITLGGNPIHTSGELPKVGTKLADFTLIQNDLSVASLSTFEGKRLIINIFPSIDTGTCAASVRKFNASAGKLENTAVLCVSRDLPFAQKRFCGAEGLENVINLSDFHSGAFGKTNGLEILDGPLSGLHSRALIVVDTDGTVIYTEQVPEIANEPNYEAALVVL